MSKREGWIVLDQLGRDSVQGVTLRPGLTIDSPTPMGFQLGDSAVYAHAAYGLERPTYYANVLSTGYQVNTTTPGVFIAREIEVHWVTHLLYPSLYWMVSSVQVLPSCQDRRIRWSLELALKLVETLREGLSSSCLPELTAIEATAKRIRKSKDSDASLDAACLALDSVSRGILQDVGPSSTVVQQFLKRMTAASSVFYPHEWEPEPL